MICSVLGRQRPQYPLEYYTRLRAEARFGCAKCGVPIVNIHHIEGYDGTHEISSLIMLCKTHHELADKNHITKEELYALKKKPYNADMVHHKFNIAPNQDVVVNIGANVFINTFIPLQIFNEPMVAIKRDNGQILLSAKFYDKHDNLSLVIRDNVWEADTDMADLRYSENTAGTDAWIAIKMKEDEPYLDVKLAKGQLYINGRFYKNGTLVDVRADGTFILGQLRFLTHMTITNAMVGINIR